MILIVVRHQIRPEYANEIASSHFKTAIARMLGLLAGPPEIIHADIAAEGWSLMAELQPATG